MQKVPANDYFQRVRFRLISGLKKLTRFTQTKLFLNLHSAHPLFGKITPGIQKGIK